MTCTSDGSRGLTHDLPMWMGQPFPACEDQPHAGKEPMSIVVLYLVLSPLLLISAVLPLWAAVDAAVRPDPAYRAIGQNKIAWILVSLFTWVIGPLVYFFAIRPKLRTASEPRLTRR
jgi:hypothetical protein